MTFIFMVVACVSWQSHFAFTIHSTKLTAVCPLKWNECRIFWDEAGKSRDESTLGNESPTCCKEHPPQCVTPSDLNKIGQLDKFQHKLFAEPTVSHRPR